MRLSWEGRNQFQSPASGNFFSYHTPGGKCRDRDVGFNPLHRGIFFLTLITACAPASTPTSVSIPCIGEFFFLRGGRCDPAGAARSFNPLHRGIFFLTTTAPTTILPTAPTSFNPLHRGIFFLTCECSRLAVQVN